MGRNLQQDVTRGTVPLCQPETSTHQERSHFREHSQRGFFVIYRFQKVIQILFYLSDRVSRNRNVLTVVKGCLAQYIVRNTRRRRSSENREHLIHIRWAESTLLVRKIMVCVTLCGDRFNCGVVQSFKCQKLFVFFAGSVKCFQRFHFAI